MNFWKSSKRPLTPPLLIFGKLCCRFFETYPENTPFVSFLCQKNPVQKSKICNKNFWIGNDPPPVWNFSKNSSVLGGWSFPYRPIKGGGQLKKSPCIAFWVSICAGKGPHYVPISLKIEPPLGSHFEQNWVPMSLGAVHWAGTWQALDCIVLSAFMSASGGSRGKITQGTKTQF